MTRFAFVTSDNTVAQVIAGDLDVSQLDQFLRDYAVLFGATSYVEVADTGAVIYIGGTYNPVDGTFAQPYTPPPPEETVAPPPVDGDLEEIITPPLVPEEVIE
jgi:hypothetical protein